jgi:hypothetical protein
MIETAHGAGNFCNEAALMLSLKKQRDVGFSEGVSYTALSRKWRRGQIKRWLCPSHTSQKRGNYDRYKAKR